MPNTVRFTCTDFSFAQNAYYFGWAMYWLMLLESNHPPYETVGHAQSAANNFLGIHLHDTQYYLRMGSWVEPELHTRYAHGNILMWHHAAHSPMYSNISSPYWTTRRDKGVLPDNIGATWIASSTCDQLLDTIEDSWVIYERSGMHQANVTFLTLAYDLFNTCVGSLHLYSSFNICTPTPPLAGRSGRNFVLIWQSVRQPVHLSLPPSLSLSLSLCLSLSLSRARSAYMLSR